MQLHSHPPANLCMDQIDPAILPLSIRNKAGKSITSTTVWGWLVLMGITLAACSGRNSTGYKPDPMALELNNGAVQALERHDFDRALELVDKAIAADSRFYSAYANRGAILQKLGREKEAIAAFKKAITLSPTFAEAYVPLGALYEKQGKTPYAKKHYAMAVQLYRGAFQEQPDDPGIAANFAIALFLNGDRDGALQCLNAYLARHPDDEAILRVKTKVEAKDRNGFIGRESRR